MRVLVVQETHWIDRNPVLHHWMLEDLSRRDDEIAVVDALWHTKERNRTTRACSTSTNRPRRFGRSSRRS